MKIIYFEKLKIFIEKGYCGTFVLSWSAKKNKHEESFVKFLLIEDKNL